MKQRFKDKFLDFVDNNNFLSSCLLFLRIRDTREKNLKYRTIFINNVRPKDYNDSDEPLDYISNKITTSKYTFWNFIPKNLFEQFRRVANFYYLFNLILTFIIPDPPVTPYIGAIPIFFVIIVSAIKQGYEDVLRHRSDREINNTPVRILRDGKFVEKKWRHIKVGDIVEVLADQTFPCDLVLLHAHTEDLMCHITTANLDGETNLKLKSKPRDFPILSNEEELSKFQGVIKCDKPNANLYDFTGKVVIHGKEYPIGNDNILLRGCNLRIAPIVYGCAVYTGVETKMLKNTKFKSNKLSCIEKRLNTFIFIFLGILISLTSACFGGSFAYSHMYDDVWYLKDRDAKYYKTNKAVFYLIVFILYMNIFNYIIPLSLYVTVELQRFVGSQFLEWDLDLYDPVTDQPAKANTSDLNEDLGQIEYLFSDKTGTLTENQMEFKQFSIDGTIYETFENQLFKLGSREPIQIFETQKLIKLFQVLSICHTVHVDYSAAEKYQASSPDEFSFVKFCAKLGLVYEGEEKCTESSGMIRKVKFFDQIYKYKVLDILEFDSDRKRMSVILKDLQEDRIILLCKGAESSIFKNCINGNIQSCDADIKTFAKQGWRTLALSYRYLTDEEYHQIDKLLKRARNDIINQKERLAEAYEEVESKLELIGATAVEDKLQEDVAYTLEELRRAGIKIWVLTGDKRETAINISHSCKHFSNNMIKLLMTDINQVEQIKKRLSHFRKQMGKNPKEAYALVIDGSTLGLLFSNNLIDQFRNICMKCEAVLCCRMTPAQKANVVRMVKKSKDAPMTAAIGDGANDVSMIQEANIGLGIFGKEGRNAARSADFAFAKFKFTRKILLVHGYLYYTRGANLVQYFFYKNLTFAICQFYFAIFSAFSVTTLYDSSIMTLYNVLYTSFPPLIYGLFEQKINIRVINKSPYLYHTIKRNKLLRWYEFLKWNVLGVWHSVVSFFFAYGIVQWDVSISNDGKMVGSALFGAMIFTQIFIVVHIKLLLEWQYKSYFILVGFGLSLFFYFIFCFILNSFIMPPPIDGLTDGQTIYWIYNYMYGTGPFWFYILLSTVTSLIPDVIFKIIDNIIEKKVTRALELKEMENMKKAEKMKDMNNGIGKNNYEFEKEDKKKRVRVFYVPTGGVNRVFDTKVKDEPIVEKKTHMSEMHDKTESLVRRNFHVNQRF
ncbi:unnamed protein product [Brachionus calyciflorus]|uniref:Phospholipid-transporting ATPase n=1 Tax=Brachionus calyciflorus TaxID=104777 RepID=A0A813M1K5_9BILA|nr:unnamed protein product [Brachionus calyciflorus]